MSFIESDGSIAKPSAFSFIRHSSSSLPAEDSRRRTHPTPKPPMHFSTSFIMEDFVSEDSNNSKIPSRRIHRRSTKAQEKQPLSKSAFQFIQREEPVPSSSSSSLLFQRQTTRSTPPPPPPPQTPSPSQQPLLSKSVIKPDNESRFLNATMQWQQIQKRKKVQLQLLESLYSREAQVNSALKKLKEKIQETDSQKTQAIDSEDFEAAHTHARTSDALKKQLAVLEASKLDKGEIRSAWKTSIDLLKSEVEQADAMISCGNSMREERQRQLAVFLRDKDRKYQQKVQQMDEMRADNEKVKSEAAFDLYMWHQSKAELDEQKKEAVHHELEQKKALQTKSETIGSEIEALRKKLQELESNQSTVHQELQKVERTIAAKLEPFQEQETALSEEKAAMAEQQQEIESRAMLLEDQEAETEKALKQQKEIQQTSEKEILDLEEQIKAATERQEAGKTEMHQLSKLLDKVVESRDQMVTQHKEQIKSVQESISSKKQKINAIQDDLYRHEQACINMEETLAKITNKLNSLQKLKNLAIKSGQFENAGALTQQIKATELSLMETREQKEGSQELATSRPADLNRQLQEATEELTLLERDLLSLEKETQEETGKTLEGLQLELEKEATDKDRFDTLRTVVQYEIQSIEAQLKEESK